MENEVTVTEKGQTTIPISLRKKYKIEKGTRLQIIETEEGILFKPKKTIWDMIGAFSDTKTADEIDKQLYKLRHENE
ncbi:MAG: AbrB/MazE/SpoVT family DNA-binding domain-containing protein [Candidatus Bathyarchaeota archaeon]|nr:AbrB/MazE/SpoVT family DNA-binding domain-containing protein [Candidatus Bathyarchaeota archaeon]